MIKLLLLVAALIAGIVVGPMLAGNQGYVLISAANQTIEMSLTTLILLVVVLLGAFFLIENILKRVFSLSSSTRGWFMGRKVRKARALTSNGLMKVIEGDWKQAEKLVVKAAKHSDTPLLNFLAAAEAAQGQGDTAQRDDYLRQASDIDQQNLAVALTRAKLQMRQKEYEQAQATLREIQQSHSRNPIMLGLLKECYVQLEDWKPLLALLPQLEKQHVINSDEAVVLANKAECGLMAHIAQHGGSDGLMGHWNSLSRKDKQRPELVACFVRQMIAKKADSEAYTVLRDSLKKQSNDTLIGLVAELDLPDRHPAIVRLQDLLRYDSNNAVTHSTLGQLFMREQKWEEAKSHFEQAVAIRPDVTDYAHLVSVLEKLNDEQGAANVSRQALTLALPAKI
ncbi:heme biosynthesis protein HemY [Photobacterium jeanii]|uniref:Heme biosynthesis protein HemY n=1 Tax=Photobacterium jeanii TaxID=858640 RepID=A0A178KQW7_9GAMM|nr:heme biosynthesis HemY N-terminal domain-containing protein [Photobacterium jeanii]OAN19164.1 heme biosynthesis protein HemY [Photobacterium jeanii]PST87171.1 tetratricopeptide repeat protein [Photobacterium jeanii]